MHIYKQYMLKEYKVECVNIEDSESTGEKTNVFSGSYELIVCIPFKFER